MCHRAPLSLSTPHHRQSMLERGWRTSRHKQHTFGPCKKNKRLPPTCFYVSLLFSLFQRHSGLGQQAFEVSLELERHAEALRRPLRAYHPQALGHLHKHAQGERVGKQTTEEFDKVRGSLSDLERTQQSREETKKKHKNGRSRPLVLPSQQPIHGLKSSDPTCVRPALGSTQQQHSE